MPVITDSSGKLYRQISYAKEAEFERAVVASADQIFGASSIYINVKKKMKGNDIVSIPDGYVVDMAEIPAFQEMSVIDQDNDGRIGAEEKRIYLERKWVDITEDLYLTFNDTPVTLELMEQEVGLRPGQNGLSTLRIQLLLRGSLVEADRRIEQEMYFRDGNYAGRIGWKEIVVNAGKGLTPTKISVIAGQTIEVAASGRVDITTWGGASVSPDGFGGGKYRNYNLPMEPFRSGRHGAAVALVAADPTAIGGVVVGRCSTFVAPFTGTLDLPLGARDGSTSRFVADADGDAAFTHTFMPCLQMSDVWTTSLLAITYHSDGKTYGADPGEWGVNSHMPLFLMLPNRSGI